MGGWWRRFATRAWQGRWRACASDAIVAGKTLYGHGGKANGMLCAAYFDPADRTGVVMLTNGCNNRATYQYVGKLTVRALQLCYTDWLNPTHVVEDPWLVETAP